MLCAQALNAPRAVQSAGVKFLAPAGRMPADRQSSGIGIRLAVRRMKSTYAMNRSSDMLKIAPLALLVLPAPALAQTFEDIAGLKALVAANTGETESSVVIDPRLRLKKCPEQPLIDPPTLGALAVRCPSLGWRIRVPVAQPLAAKAATAPLVRRGDLVEIVAVGAGYSVSSSGTALEDGAKGAAIRIKTGNTSLPVTAVVDEIGRVVINN